MKEKNGILLSERRQWKGYILYNSNYKKALKRQDYGDVKRSMVARGYEGGKDELAEHRGFLGQ